MEQMRLAEERGNQWIQGKRDEANSAQMKANSLLQTATRTQQKVLHTFAPDGSVVKRTVGTVKGGKKQKKDKKLQKPTFNPFMPNEIAR